MRNRIRQIVVGPEQSIRSVMTVIQEATRQLPEPAPSGIVLVVDAADVLLGVVTDGDMRRAVLSHRDLDAPVSDIMNKNPVSVPANLPSAEMIRHVSTQLAARGPDGKMDPNTTVLARIVVVDHENKPVDILSFFELWRMSEVSAQKACVMGLGFVGLTLAVTLADVGFEVIGVERDEKILESLKRGEPHFYEKNLQALLGRHANKNLTFVRSLEGSVADIYIVSVGTPLDEVQNRVDYGALTSAADDIAKVLKPGDLIVLRSTVPVSTTRQIFIPRIEASTNLRAGRDFSVVFAPERTIEGKALEELRSLPQVVGGLDSRSADLGARLFRTMSPTIVTVPSLEAAEMVKLINNSFRDLIFAFSNQIAILCDKFQLPVKTIINAANEGYPRDRVPKPSPGVGGICLRKDPYLLIESAVNAGVEAPLTFHGRRLNKSIPGIIADKIAAFMDKSGLKPEEVTLGFLGLAFKGKPETSDIRGSTALDLAKELRIRGFTGRYLSFDPLAAHEELRQEGFEPLPLEDVFKQAQAVLIMNNHPVFETLNLPQLCAGSQVKYFFDGWHLHHPSSLQCLGVYYDALGTDAAR
ncbi:MAG: nucleotide sugar dehydrogenase [Patescibacteria group bacterium]